MSLFRYAVSKLHILHFLASLCFFVGGSLEALVPSAVDCARLVEETPDGIAGHLKLPNTLHLGRLRALKRITGKDGPRNATHR